MKNVLKLEELAQFGLILFALAAAHQPWWIFLLLLLGPDIGMLGYLINTKAGALTYNLLHHKGVAIGFVIAGAIVRHSGPFELTSGKVEELLLIIGLILYGHSSMDRMLGYGLKFSDHFQHTHLGWIGKGQQEK